MVRMAYIVVVALVLALPMQAVAATTVIVNGKQAAVPVIEKDGKAYVDIMTLMKLLGGKATYDAANHKVYINGATATTTPQPTKTAAAGTAQLPGENAEFGVVYAMRQSNPVYFTLLRAEYTTQRVCIGDRLFVPKAGEKLLVIHYALQNPQSDQEVLARWDTLRFTVVDAFNINHEQVDYVGDERTGELLDMALKPAQKVEGYTLFTVPAKGVVPKLMVLPGDDGPVLRYDLRGKVTPLSAPYVDPVDDTGAHALDVVPFEMNTPISLEAFDATVEKVEYSDGPVGDQEPEEGGKLAIVTLTVKNQTRENRDIRWDSFIPALFTEDGELLEWYEVLWHATANRLVEQELKPGQTLRVRTLFGMPEGVEPKRLQLRESDEGRTYEVQLP
jgi:hypothetical protein